jgi:hypothetical protein
MAALYISRSSRSPAIWPRYKRGAADATERGQLLANKEFSMIKSARNIFPCLSPRSAPGIQNVSDHVEPRYQLRGAGLKRAKHSRRRHHVSHHRPIRISLVLGVLAVCSTAPVAAEPMAETTPSHPRRARP